MFRTDPTPESVVQSWIKDGNSNEELVQYILVMTGSVGREVLGEYVESRIQHDATWSFIPTARIGENLYEVTALADIHLEIHESSDLKPPLKGYISAMVDIHHTVDMRSEKVIDWHFHQSDAIFDTNLLPLVYDASEAECLEAANRFKLPYYAMEILSKPQIERSRAELMQLNAALSATGIIDICKDM